MSRRNNRITAEGAVLLGRGLAVNESLHVLKVHPYIFKLIFNYTSLSTVQYTNFATLKLYDFITINYNIRSHNFVVPVRV